MTRRVRQLRASVQWTDEHIGTLLSGHDYFGAFTWANGPCAIPHRSREGWDEPQHVEAKLRQAVEDIGDELLTNWIAERPGTRSWFWWRFSAPEPRRCLNGPHRYTRPECAAVSHRLRFGLPTWGLAPDFGKGETYESELAYLERLDLLTDHERELLPAAAAPSAVENQ